MRTYVAVAAITTAVLTAVAIPVATSATPSQAPTHSTSQTLPYACRAMQHIPSYYVTLNAQGEGYRIAKGSTLVRMAQKSSETSRDLHYQCQQLIMNYANDLAVIEENR